jgi:hypothetical protein
MEVKTKHHGEIIKEFLLKHRIPQKEFCKNLGFAASNFDMALMREKVSPKHQLKIKELYGIDLDNYHESDTLTTPLLAREKGAEYQGGSGASCEKLLAAKEEIILELRQRIKDKEEIIELLKSQK